MIDLAVGVPVATVWTGPDAPRPIDKPAVSDVPDMDSWTRGMDVAARHGLHGRTLTQTLLGERVDVVADHGDWVEVRLPEQPSSTDPVGYPGWMRRAHLDTAPEPAETTVVVTAARADLATPPAAVTVTFGTRLPARARSDQSVTVELPGSCTGWLSVGDVQQYVPGTAVDVSALLASARQFLGVRYLWGGTSTWGLDCSGLVHLVQRAHGVTVPRDAFDQHDAAQPVPLDEAVPGDLYFFARPHEPVHHVGFVTNLAGTGPRTMLHAPEGGEQIEDTTVAPHRLASMVAAGRF